MTLDLLINSAFYWMTLLLGKETNKKFWIIMSSKLAYVN